MRNSFLIFIILIAITGKSQTIGWEYKMKTIADNREYFNIYAPHQTILGLRNGFTLNTDFDSVHSIYAGVDYMIEYGNDMDALSPDITLFYKYSDKNVLVHLGMFPRENVLVMPLILLTDSIEYYKPNMSGGLARVHGNWGFQQVWIDWTGRQTMTIRESFLTGVNGQLKAGIFYLEDYAYMFHHAVSANIALKEHIRDNMCVAGYLGVNLTEKTPLDSLRLDAGVVFSQDRTRPDEYRRSGGFTARANAHYKRFMVDAVYYNGDKQLLPWGDIIYTSKNYTRLDLGWVPFKSKHVSSAIKSCFHLANGDFDVSQQIFVTVKLGKQNIPAPNLFD